jgi:processive 1,2-diacylglycerol beta-glucosyltransferase
MGLGIEEAVLAALEAGVEGLQVVAVCGRNEGARSRLADLGVSAERLQVHGYLNGIERYLAAADVVVTKPGGLTTSEALALGRPLLLTRPIPGQEEGNVRTLTAAGAAVSVPEPESLRRALGWIFGEPRVLAGLGAGARRLGRSDAAARIADSICRGHLAGMPVMA